MGRLFCFKVCVGRLFCFTVFVGVGRVATVADPEAPSPRPSPSMPRCRWLLAKAMARWIS